MRFTRREQIIIIATILVVGLLVLDSWVFTPLIESWDELHAQKNVLQRKVAKANSILRRRRASSKRWKEMVSGANAMKTNPIDAESQTMNAINHWTGKTGFSLTSIRPERSTEETPLPEIAFHSSGTGNMKCISKLIWLAQTAESPARICSVRITSRKDGVDDLSMLMTLSTVYQTRAEGKQKPENNTEEGAGK